MKLRRTISKGLALVLITSFYQGVYSCKDSRKNEPKKPNIVFILVDDLGWSDLGFMGSKYYETPNVDRFATEGMYFIDFYSGGPVCSPTRTSILTGKYTARTGITTYLITPEKDVNYISHHLELSEYTLAEALRDNGYITGLFGKWHLGYKSEHWASNQGFMVAIGGTTSQNAWSMLYPDKDPPVKQNEVLYFSPHYLTHMDDGPQGEYITDRLTNETINFIESNCNGSKPFFAFLSFHTVHTPLEAKPEIIEKYRKKFTELGILSFDDMENGSRKYQNLPEYAAMVHQMDENVGRLLEKIDELGIRDNTIIVYSSDNGGKHSVTSNFPLRGAKHNLYEGGIRVPLIIRWPDVIKVNSKCGEPLISNDLYPTLLDLANLPSVPEQHVDGISFKKLLTGQGRMENRNALYWHYPHGVFQGALRMGDYKLVYNYKTGEAELYNISKDLSEREDLSKAEYTKVQKMKNMLREWLVEVNARFPEEGISLP
jgi:arylsulfatase A-like enzyme